MLGGRNRSGSRLKKIFDSMNIKLINEMKKNKIKYETHGVRWAGSPFSFSRLSLAARWAAVILIKDTIISICSQVI